MAGYAETIERLMAELGKLPGIGARSAERLAFYRGQLQRILHQALRSGIGGEPLRDAAP